MDNFCENGMCYGRCNGVIHTIKKGDTLYLISKFYRVPIGEIMAANREIDIYNLQIGDELCIPVKRVESMPDIREDILDKIDDALDEMQLKLSDVVNDPTMTLQKFLNIIQKIKTN